MNKYTKVSLAIGTFLALATLAAQGVFAAGQLSYAMAKVMWNTAPGVKMYNLYYKESGEDLIIVRMQV